MSKKKVLVVDDQPSITILLAEVLKHAGYETLVTYNGQEALSLMEQQHPDAVIMDVKMPGIDGIELLCLMRSSGSTVPVIIMTAYGELQIIEKAKMLGVHTHFMKPFDITEMLQAVNDLFSASGISPD
jgi:two-component system, response regulator, stage 0 sporulation protein F